MKKYFAALLLVFNLVFALPVLAETPPASENNPELSAQDVAYIHAIKNALSAATPGPSQVILLNEAILHLPENYIYIPKQQAQVYMESMGNQIDDESFQGIIMPKENSTNWFITINYIKSGYVRDEEAKDWNADDLFKTLKEGNDEANKERAKQKMSGLDIIGWIEPPKYDTVKHRLVWSMLAKDQAATKEDDAIVNYNTYALGRNGYFKLNLVTPKTTVEKNKLYAQTILANLDFNNGNRYEDFNEKTDHIAAYGIAALVGGVVAKKLGLLAVIGVFLLKFAKIGVLVVAAFFGKIKAALRKLFNRNASETPKE